MGTGSDSDGNYDCRSGNGSDGGFKIINLSEVVKEIDDENVYLISWKKVFKDNYNLKVKQIGGINGTDSE